MRSRLLLVFVLLWPTLLASASSQVTVSQTNDFSIGGIASWLHKVLHSVNQQKTSQHAQLQSDQFQQIYDALRDLQLSRENYLAALQVLIDAREHHESKQALRAQRDNFRAKAKIVSSKLNELVVALRPLHLDVDLNNPKFGKAIEEYQIKQETAMNASTDENMATGYTIQQLRKLQRDVIANGVPLQQAIDSLQVDLKHWYASSRQ